MHIFPVKTDLNTYLLRHTRHPLTGYSVAPIVSGVLSAYADRVQNTRKSGSVNKQSTPAAQTKRASASRGLHKLELNSPTLVWIDDYEPGLVMYKMMYENLGYNVHTASRGNEGLEILASRSADAVIVDYEMPEMDGGAVTESIKKRWPGMPVIMFSGSAIVPPHVTNLVDAFCDKAGRREDLQLAIQNVLQKKQNLQPNLV